MVADADLGMGGRVLEKINKNLIDGNLGFFFADLHVTLVMS